LIVLLVWLSSPGMTEIGTPVPLPPHLVGVWRTSEPKYADRFVEISDHTVVFGTGGGTRTIHAISHVSFVDERGRLLYTVWYWDGPPDDRVGQTLSFYYDPEPRVIRLKNQQDIAWVNVGRPPSLQELIEGLEASQATVRPDAGDPSVGGLTRAAAGQER
jgi:hypothetical protein